MRRPDNPGGSETRPYRAFLTRNLVCEPKAWWLRFLDDQVDGRGKAAPARGFRLKLCAARGGQRVELRLASGFRVLPLGLDPALLFEPVQGRIERALLHLQDIVEICWIRLAMAQPCLGSSETVLRISRSSVPWTRSLGFPIL